MFNYQRVTLPPTPQPPTVEVVVVVVEVTVVVTVVVVLVVSVGAMDCWGHQLKSPWIHSWNMFSW